MLGSVVDDKLAVSAVIMRRYCLLRCLLRDYCRIIQLQCNIRGLIVPHIHVSGMTARKKTAAPQRRFDFAWQGQDYAKILTFGSSRAPACE